MRDFRPGRRLATAAVIAAAAIGAAGPAQADNAKPEPCEGGEQRLEQQFREIEAKRGWEAAAKWWDKAWARYYEHCLAP